MEYKFIGRIGIKIGRIRFKYTIFHLYLHTDRCEDIKYDVENKTFVALLLIHCYFNYNLVINLLFIQVSLICMEIEFMDLFCSIEIFVNFYIYSSTFYLATAQYFALK